MADTGFKTSGTITSTGAGTFSGLDVWADYANAATVNSLVAFHGVSAPYVDPAYPFQRISETLQLRNFTASVPSGATINGIQVAIQRYKQDDFGNGAALYDYRVQLVKGGTASGDNKANTGTDWTTSTSEVLYGGSTDLWGLSLTQSDVNGSTFGVDVQVRDNAGSDFFTNVTTAAIDAVRIKVYYTESGGGTTTVEQSKTFSYNKRAYAEQSKTKSYNKRAYVEQSKTKSYNKRAFIEQSKTFSYNKSTYAEQSKTFSYNASGLISSESSFSYNKRSFVEQDKTFSYNKRLFAEQSSTFSYDVSAFVEQAKTFSYSMSGQVTAEITFSYDISAFVDQSKTFSYNARNYAEQSLTNSWNSKSYAEQNKTFSWSSTSYIEQNRTHSYNKRTYAEQSNTFSYDKLESSLTQVEQTYTFSYDKSLFVENSGTYSFNKRAFVEQQKTFNYDKRTFVEQSKTQSYNKRAFTEQQKTFSYNVLANGSVTATFSHSYNISNYVFADLSNSWNIIQVSYQKREFPYMTKTILLSPKEMLALRNNVTAWLPLKILVDSELDYEPEPLVDYRTVSAYNNAGHTANEISARLYESGARAYRAALCYQMTGDVLYANKAKEIIEAWYRTLRRIEGFSAQGTVGFHLPYYIVAADWIRNVKGWDGNDFADFLRRKVLPQTRHYYKNNVATWWSALEACIYAYLDDYDGLLQTKSRVIDQINEQMCIYSGQGGCLLTFGNLSLEQKFYTFPEETTRSGTSNYNAGPDIGKRGLSYSHFLMRSLTICFEILLKEGVNMYITDEGLAVQKFFNKLVGWVKTPSTFIFYDNNLDGEGNSLLDNVRQCGYFATLARRYEGDTTENATAITDAKAIINAGILGDAWQFDLLYQYKWNPPQDVIEETEN